MQIVGASFGLRMKLWPTGARDLSSVGMAEEDANGGIACEQAPTPVI
jgi:hypothetical protein